MKTRIAWPRSIILNGIDWSTFQAYTACGGEHKGAYQKIYMTQLWSSLAARFHGNCEQAGAKFAQGGHEFEDPAVVSTRWAKIPTR